MDKIQMVDLTKQYEAIKAEVDQEMQNVIDTTSFINGPAVAKFSDALGKYIGSPNMVTCANGTDAIQIALMALNFPKGSEIIVPSFNYVASAEVIALMGFIPIFVDAHDDLFNLDVNQVEEKLTKKTRAIIAVHLFGQSSQLLELKKICEAHNLILIEDNAQAIGGHYLLNGVKINNGLIGDIGTTSFFPSKNLGCYGDGGAVYSKHEDLFLKMKKMANHGQAMKYEYDEIGINSRLDSIQAAVLNVKLKKLDLYINRRREVAEFYDKAFAEIEGVESPKRCEDSYHVFHQYTLKVNPKKRDHLKEALLEKGIPSMIYYPKPLHLNKAYNEFRNAADDFPVAEKLSQCVISLPMHTELSSEQLVYICDNFKSIIKSI